MSIKSRPLILVILDGFGASSVEEGNSILSAKMPNLDYLYANFPKTLLHASASEVGLEPGEVGNSEVGHLNLGTGRIVMQDLTRINESIKNKSFFSNKSLINACNKVNKNNSTLHLIGLVSNGGVHSSINHLLALMDLAKIQQVQKLSIHIITDGRDTPAKSAQQFIQIIDKKINEIKIGQISTICGRFYAMDRDKNWERTQKAYDLIVSGMGKKFSNAQSAIENAYENNQNDENIEPSLLDNANLIRSNDSVICFNFRQDRTSQIASTLIDDNFSSFQRKNQPKIFFSGFVSYGDEPDINTQVAFFQSETSNQLASIVSQNNFLQLHASETEKYAHVTYFFNGGHEKEFQGESRILIPSPKVESYDLVPEMSLEKVVDQFILNFKKNMPHFSVINFANPDMVGHTGNLQSAIKACEFVDKNLAKIIKLSQELDANLIITSDHGNCEQMISPHDGSIDKNHTTNPVPMVLACPELKLSDNNFSLEEKISFFSQEPTGVIADISPTIIDLLNLQHPEEMTGQSLKDLI